MRERVYDNEDWQFKNADRCPVCDHEKTTAIDTRNRYGTKRRVRECCSCSARWRTVEISYDEIKELLATKDAYIAIFRNARHIKEVQQCLQ